MTSATERLRALLDERGVEYDTDDEDGCEFTEWVANGLEWEADSRGELVGLMPVMLITPEQAIAATLGSCNCSSNCTNGERTNGTCHIEEHFGEWYCTGCGDMVGTCDPDSELCVDGNYVSMWNYCPNCGRKVINE